MRSEFQAIFILSIFYLLITISPYLIRNFIIFEKITLAKTFGYNLWKGNHPNALKNSLVEGSEIFDKSLQEQEAKYAEGFVVLDAIPKDKNYRFKFNEFFLEQAIKNIKKDPAGYSILFLKKAISFILIDVKSSDPNYYNPLHYLPILILSITSLFGIILSDKKSYHLNYLILVFFTCIFIFSIVSILPRYKLIILPLQIIFTNIFIVYIKEKIFCKNKETYK